MLRPLAVPLLLTGVALGGCRADPSPHDPPVVDPSDMSYFCNLPGTLRSEADGVKRVAGGSGSEQVAFASLPAGFCAHYFGSVGNVRHLRFAPGGELFVASPTKTTTGGGRQGRSAIIVMPDDDGDGAADQLLTFMEGLPATQGMMFADDYFYYQDGTKILRTAYMKGQRSAMGESELVADVGIYYSDLHWPKPIDQAADGTIYIGNGGDQNETCDTSRPFHGGILKLDGTPGGTPVARGFRNPIAIRCQREHNVCLTAELAMDYSAGMGGREKLVPIREDDDWGFPCCQTQDIPASNLEPVPDCSGTSPEDVSFVIGDTPFTFDIEPGLWSPPYKGSVFVPLHGEAGTWKGARVVAIDVNPDTGLPLAATNLPNTPPGAMREFISGWDDGARRNGRPSVIAFASDGRMFVGNDNDGKIFWVAPFDLRRSAP